MLDFRRGPTGLRNTESEAEGLPPKRVIDEVDEGSYLTDDVDLYTVLHRAQVRYFGVSGS